MASPPPSPSLPRGRKRSCSPPRRRESSSSPSRGIQLPPSSRARVHTPSPPPVDMDQLRAPGLPQADRPSHIYVGGLPTSFGQGSSSMMSTTLQVKKGYDDVLELSGGPDMKLPSFCDDVVICEKGDVNMSEVSEGPSMKLPSFCDDVVICEKGDVNMSEVSEGTLGDEGTRSGNLFSLEEDLMLSEKSGDSTPKISGGPYIGGSSSATKLPRLKHLTFNEISSATDGFNSNNLLSQFGPSVYQGLHDTFGKVLLKIFEGDDYAEGVERFTNAASRTHPNLIELVGGLIEENRVLLVFNFQFLTSLRGRLAGDNEMLPDYTIRVFNIYYRYKIALGVAKALNNLWEQNIPLIPKALTDEHVLLVDEYDFPILVDLVGCGGTGDLLDSTRHIVQHYGVLIRKLRVLKGFHDTEPTLRNKEWEEL